MNLFIILFYCLLQSCLEIKIEIIDEHGPLTMMASCDHKHVTYRDL